MIRSLPTISILDLTYYAELRSMQKLVPVHHIFGSVLIGLLSYTLQEPNICQRLTVRDWGVGISVCDQQSNFVGLTIPDADGHAL
jgi:hypothetical protein